MAIQEMVSVWKHSRSSGGTLLLLLAIADNANEDSGLAWPSIETLARKTRMSERQVQRCIQTAEGLEELEVVRRPNKTTLYRILLGHPKTKPGGDILSSREQGTTSDVARGDIRRRTGTSDVTQNLLRTVRTPNKRSSARSAPEYTAAFMELWDAYPPRNGRREKKAEAFEQYEKLGPDALLQATLLEAIAILRRTTDFPPDMVRFLRHRRWEDDINPKVVDRRKAQQRPAATKPAAAPPVADDPVTEEDRRQIREHLQKLPKFLHSLGEKVLGDPVGDDSGTRKACADDPDMLVAAHA